MATAVYRASSMLLLQAPLSRTCVPRGSWMPCLRIAGASARPITAYSVRLKEGSRSSLAQAEQQVASPERAERVLLRSWRDDLPKEVRDTVAKMSRLGKARDFEQALAVFQQALDANLQDRMLWDAALNVCRKAAWYDKANNFWFLMPQEFKTVVSYSTMISLCGRTSRLRRAESLFNEMKQHGIEPNVITYLSLINAYGAAGYPDKAVSTFESIRTTLLAPSTAETKQSAYLAAMAACGRHGDYATAYRLFAQMSAEGVPPDQKHFNTLLLACAQRADAATAKGVFETMTQWNLKPRTEDYTALMACCRDQLQECLDIRAKMLQAGVELGPLTYQALLEAHVLAGDVAGARTMLAEASAPTGRLPPGLDDSSGKGRRLLAQLRELEERAASSSGAASSAGSAGDRPQSGTGGR